MLPVVTPVLCTPQGDNVSLKLNVPLRLWLCHALSGATQYVRDTTLLSYGYICAYGQMTDGAEPHTSPKSNATAQVVYPDRHDADPTPLLMAI